MTKPLYFWNGSSFELVGPTTPQSPFAYQTSAPTAPATGDIWIDSDGDVDTYNRQLTRYYFVASAGQTSVSGTDANGLTLAYVAGSEAVYVNGALQVRGVDYTATNGTSITNLSALALNDVVEVFAYTAFTVANAYTKSETDSVAAAAPGVRLIVPSSVTVGSGTATISTGGEVTFSGASSVSLNTVFSSTYQNYRIIITLSSVSAALTLRMRLRSGTTDASGADYNGSYIRLASGTTSVVGDYYSGNTSFDLTNALLSTTGNRNSISMDLYNPQLARPTTSTSVNSEQLNSGGHNIVLRATLHGLSTSYDGLSLITSTGTMDGEVSVFGYKA